MAIFAVFDQFLVKNLRSFGGPFLTLFLGSFLASNSSHWGHMGSRGGQKRGPRPVKNGKIKQGMLVAALLKLGALIHLKRCFSASVVWVGVLATF